MVAVVTVVGEGEDERARGAPEMRVGRIQRYESIAEMPHGIHRAQRRVVGESDRWEGERSLETKVAGFGETDQ